MTNEWKFCYQEKVRVVSGFYKGQGGVVESREDRIHWVWVHLGYMTVHEYIVYSIQLHTGKEITVHEEDLEKDNTVLIPV